MAAPHAHRALRRAAVRPYCVSAPAPTAAFSPGLTDPAAAAQFCTVAYQRSLGGDPLVLHEDWAGSGAVALEWLRGGTARTAVLRGADEEAMALGGWGPAGGPLWDRASIADPGSGDAAAQGDVCCSLSMQWCAALDDAHLREWLADVATRARLLVVDLHGGPAVERTGVGWRVALPGGAACRWRHAAWDPRGRVLELAAAAGRRAERRLRLRLRTAPEAAAAMRDAGMEGVTVWHPTDSGAFAPADPSAPPPTAGGRWAALLSAVCPGGGGGGGGGGGAARAAASAAKRFAAAWEELPQSHRDALASGGAADAERLVHDTDLPADTCEAVAAAASAGGAGRVATARGVLTAEECAALRRLADRSCLSTRRDSVDGAPEFQLNLSLDALRGELGPEAAQRLLALPRDCFDPAAPSTESGFASIEIFLRRYDAGSRPFLPLHCDASDYTAAVALTDDGESRGGRLLVVHGGQCAAPARRAGEATVHSSDVLHGVSLLAPGQAPRYSLVLFYHRHR